MALDARSAARYELKQRIIALGLTRCPPYKICIVPGRSRQFPEQAIVVNGRGKRVQSIASIPIADGMP